MRWLRPLCFFKKAISSGLTVACVFDNYPARTVTMKLGCLVGWFLFFIEKERLYFRRAKIEIDVISWRKGG